MLVLDLECCVDTAYISKDCWGNSTTYLMILGGKHFQTANFRWLIYGMQEMKEDRKKKEYRPPPINLTVVMEHVYRWLTPSSQLEEFLLKF